VLTPPPLAVKIVVRTILVLGFVLGLALLAAAVTSEAPPTWWWVAGVLSTLVGGSFVEEWLRFRLRYRTPEARREYLERFLEGASQQEPGRARLAHQAIKHKKAVLRSGIDGTAVVTFLADGHRGNEVQHLLYLEFDVRIGDGAPYPVRTGEYLTAASSGTVCPGRELAVKVDPQNPQHVAVDWERSLRLRPPA